MRSFYCSLLVVLVLSTGCDALKQFMPAPTANKPISVPVSAKVLTLDTPDGINIPPNAPGEYYIVEDDTSHVALYFAVAPGEASESALTPKRREQLDSKRKYRVYYSATTPGTTPSPVTPATPSSSITPTTPATPPANPGPAAQSPYPASPEPMTPTKPAPAPSSPAEPSPQPANPLAPSAPAPSTPAPETPTPGQNPLAPSTLPNM